jgi:hypothetical protein
MNEVVAGSAMNQEKPKRLSQVFYNGRWVDKDFFMAFVYSIDNQKLANNHKEYESLIATGLWFDNRALAIDAKKVLEQPIAEVLELKQPKARKPKDGADSKRIPD